MQAASSSPYISSQTPSRQLTSSSETQKRTISFLSGAYSSMRSGMAYVVRDGRVLVGRDEHNEEVWATLYETTHDYEVGHRILYKIHGKPLRITHGDVKHWEPAFAPWCRRLETRTHEFFLAAKIRDAFYRTGNTAAIQVSARSVTCFSRPEPVSNRIPAPMHSAGALKDEMTMGRVSSLPPSSLVRRLV